MRVYKDHFDWSDLKKLIEEKKTLREIARIKGCSMPSVRRNAIKMGIAYEKDMRIIIKRVRKRDGWAEKMKGNKYALGLVSHFKGKKRLEISGDKHWNWQGGIAEDIPRNQLFKGYGDWRRSVYKRDGYRCVLCGHKKSGDLQAHHIKPVKSHKELVVRMDNGLTVCIKCHKEIHYGKVPKLDNKSIS